MDPETTNPKPYLPINPSTYLPMYLSIYLSIYVSLYLSIYLPIYLRIYVCTTETFQGCLYHLPKVRWALYVFGPAHSIPRLKVHLADSSVLPSLPTICWGLSWGGVCIAFLFVGASIRIEYTPLI